MLKLKNLSVSIGDKKILKNINFHFEKGKIYAIMGPNGSGKSSLALTLMSHPSYKMAEESEIILNKKNITNLTVDERAKEGIFLSFQSPLIVNGVKANELLQLALTGKKDPLTLRQEINKISEKLKINPDLLNRSLNEGASGGERKKLEVLQAAVLNKPFQIFDEIDTGVDVDALKVIGRFLKANKKIKTYVVITHYNRILRYVKPDYVIVIVNGEIKKVGDYKVAEEIEKNGYEKFSTSLRAVAK